MTNQIIDGSVLCNHYQLMYLMGCVRCNDYIFWMSGRSTFGRREPRQATLSPSDLMLVGSAASSLRCDSTSQALLCISSPASGIGRFSENPWLPCYCADHCFQTSSDANLRTTRSGFLFIFCCFSSVLGLYFLLSTLKIFVLKETGDDTFNSTETSHNY